MTKRYALSSIATVLGALVLITAFQNCGGGDLPSNTDAASNVTAKSALTLIAPSASMVGGSTMSFSATGGTPPYTFSIVSGPGSMDGASGLFSTVASDSGTLVVRVTDAQLATNDAMVAVGVNPSTLITAGTAVFNLASGAQTFSVPNHHSMTIQVWGAGGGGGGLGYIPSPDSGSNGANGGVSQVSGQGVSIVAGGGVGGTHGRVRFFSGSPGAGGAATGGNSKNVSGATAPGQAGGNAPNGGGLGGTYAAGGAAAHTVGTVGGIPGGGGGSTSFNDGQSSAVSGGGGAGAYAESVLTLTSGSTLSVTVGAGGTAGSGGFGAAGGAGRVVVTWN